MADIMKFHEDCVFCKIMRGDIPANMVYEDSFCFAFRDINPQAPVHILIVPRGHISSMNELRRDNSTIMGHLFTAVAKIAAQEGIDGSGYRVVCNCGADAGQTVDHLHLHLLGGKKLEERQG